MYCVQGIPFSITTLTFREALPGPPQEMVQHIKYLEKECTMYSSTPVYEFCRRCFLVEDPVAQTAGTMTMFLLEVIKGNAFASSPSVFDLRDKAAVAQNINLQTNNRLKKLIQATLGDGHSRLGNQAAGAQIAGENAGKAVRRKKKLTTAKGMGKGGNEDTVEGGGAGKSGTKNSRPPKSLNQQRVSQTKVISSQVWFNCSRL